MGATDDDTESGSSKNSSTPPQISPYRATRLIFKAVSLFTLLDASTRLVGDTLGADEGNSVGTAEGSTEGCTEGANVGFLDVGTKLGSTVGFFDGELDGFAVGRNVGVAVVGNTVGAAEVGANDGIDVGMAEVGEQEGSIVGQSDGTAVGLTLGAEDGYDVALHDNDGPDTKFSP